MKPKPAASMKSGLLGSTSVLNAIVWGGGILKILKASKRVVGEARACSVDEVRVLGGPSAFRTLQCRAGVYWRYSRPMREL